MQVEIRLEVRQVFEGLAQLRPAPAEPLLPNLALNGADDEIPVLPRAGREARGAARQLRLQLVPVGDDQLAAGAVAAGLAQHQRPEALDVDEEGELARVGRAF